MRHPEETLITIITASSVSINNLSTGKIIPIVSASDATIGQKENTNQPESPCLKKKPNPSQNESMTNKIEERDSSSKDSGPKSIKTLPPPPVQYSPPLTLKERCRQLELLAEIDRNTTEDRKEEKSSTTKPLLKRIADIEIKLLGSIQNGGLLDRVTSLEGQKDRVYALELDIIGETPKEVNKQSLFERMNHLEKMLLGSSQKGALILRVEFVEEQKHIVDKLELAIIGTTDKENTNNQSLLQRIDDLEMKLLGSPQTGSLIGRVATIEEKRDFVMNKLESEEIENNGCLLQAIDNLEMKFFGLLQDGSLIYRFTSLQDKRNLVDDLEFVIIGENAQENKSNNANLLKRIDVLEKTLLGSTQQGSFIDRATYLERSKNLLIDDLRLVMINDKENDDNSINQSLLQKINKHEMMLLGSVKDGSLVDRAAVLNAFKCRIDTLEVNVIGKDNNNNNKNLIQRLDELEIFILGYTQQEQKEVNSRLILLEEHIG